jgi:hypothetical protein
MWVVNDLGLNWGIFNLQLAQFVPLKLHIG